ncbi:MAG TPA: hypothetical protein PLT28_00100 [Saprospiraceae bacterium]|nr:hypothetical protein [Saprospiraceae bacterium]
MGKSYKIGDKVRIRSDLGFLTDEERHKYDFIGSMLEYAGEVATITDISAIDHIVWLDIDMRNFYWNIDLLEDINQPYFSEADFDAFFTSN